MTFFYDLKEIRYRSQHFGFSYDNFLQMLEGKKTHEDKLLAHIIMIVPRSHVNNIVSGASLLPLDEVKYVDINTIKKLFNVPHINEWKSAPKIKLRRFLLFIPECYLDFYFATVKAGKALESLFPTVEPIEDICSKCVLESTCSRPEYCEYKEQGGLK